MAMEGGAGFLDMGGYGGYVWPAFGATALVLSLLLIGERIVAWNVSTTLPEGGGFNEWRWVLSAPWGRVGIIAGIVVAATTVLLSFFGTARESRPSRRALLVSLRAGACGAGTRCAGSASCP